MRVYLETYLPNSLQQFQLIQEGYKWTSFMHVILNLSQIFNTILTCLAPVVIYFYFRSQYEHFREQEFRARFGDSTDILNHRNNSASVYFLVFCFKRLMLVLLIVFGSTTYLQVLGTIYTVQTCVIVQGWANPFRYRGYRYLEMFNDVTTLIWCYFLFTMTDFVPNPDTRYLVGHYLITLVSVNITVNLMYVNYCSFVEYRHEKRVKKIKAHRET